MSDEDQREALNDALTHIQSAILDAEYASNLMELRRAVSYGFEAVLRILETKDKS